MTSVPIIENLIKNQEEMLKRFNDAGSHYPYTWKQTMRIRFWKELLEHVRFIEGESE